MSIARIPAANENHPFRRVLKEILFFGGYYANKYVPDKDEAPKPFTKKIRISKTELRNSLDDMTKAYYEQKGI